MTTPIAAAFTGELISQEFLNQIIDALNQSNAAFPGGSVISTIAAAAPPGWALLNGQTIVNASTLYPETWAAAPLTWKSGSNLILADARGKTTFGADGAAFVLGNIGGANTKVVATANLPAHAHDLAHGHTGTYSGYTSDAVDHTYGGNGQHQHGPLGGGRFVRDGLGGDSAGIGAGTGYALDTQTAASGNLHQHDYSGNVAIAAASGNTGPTGSGTPLDVVPSNLSLNLIVRLR